MGKEYGNDPENYGQSQILSPPWPQGAPKVVLDWKEPRHARESRVSGQPWTHAVMLALQLPAGLSPENQIWRWRLDFGVGGTRQSFLIDGLGVQQISVPFDAFRASVVSELGIIGSATAPAPAYQAPTYQVTGSVFLAAGTTVSPFATLTQWFQVAAGENITLTLPAGTVAWRLHGQGDAGAANGPFIATMEFRFPNTLTLEDRFTGDQLLPLHSQDGFISVPGGTKFLLITNTSAATRRGAIQWEIDF